MRDDETNPLVSLLRLSGVVQMLGGMLYIRNRIYQRVFDAGWVVANMPDQEIRRQRGAFRRGLLRGSVAAAIILALLGGGGWLVAKQIRLWHIHSTIAKLGTIYGSLSSYADVTKITQEVVLDAMTHIPEFADFRVFYRHLASGKSGPPFGTPARNILFVRYGEKFDGRDTYVLAWEELEVGREPKAVPVTAWVDADNGGIIQLKKDYTGIATLEMPNFASGTVRRVEASGLFLTGRYSNVKLNPTFAAKDFEFTPPPNAREVQEFSFNPAFSASSGQGPPPQPAPRFDATQTHKLIVQRSPQTPAELLDLTPHYNAPLSEPWHSAQEGNDLSQLPPGVQELGSVKFDVRGIIQLASRAQGYLLEKYPTRVDGMQVKRMCRHLHFLHATGWSSPEGTQIGQYVIHYSDGQQRVIPIIYGYDVLDWLAAPSEPITTGLIPVWVGTNRAVSQANSKLRLYKTSWTNPRPEVPIESLDFSSAMANAAPFLIAVTVE